jgi:hypothetical protein
VERRNRNNKDKKKAGGSGVLLLRSKSRDRGLADLRTGGRRTVKHLVNTLLGKDHKNHIFGAKDHHARGDQEATSRVTARLRERRLSAPGLGAMMPPASENGGVELSFLAAETRSLMRASEVTGKADLRGGSAVSTTRRMVIGHPSSSSTASAGIASSEAGFPLASRPHLRGPATGQGAAQYRRFQDSSFSSFRQHCPAQSICSFVKFQTIGSGKPCPSSSLA